MKLWIRSQDRERLIKCNSVMLNISDTRCILANFNGKDDYTYSVYDHIGKYKTKERALEVLDEIQNKLMPISVYKQEVDNLTIDFKNIDTIVYEMPKE